jgi:hypothetical protein
MPPNDKQLHDHDLKVICYQMSEGTAYSAPFLNLKFKDDPDWAKNLRRG